MRNLITKLKRNLVNIPGWRCKRKLIIFESDDWGSIRMPSRGVYDKLLRLGYRVDLHPYEKYDSLASEEDLTALFDVLIKYKDKNGNHPVITANCLVANPNFQKIEENNFEEYFYEPFTETLKRYDNHLHSFDLWKQGINEKIFIPQFHGREHLNVAEWMDSLQMNNADIKLAFDYKMNGIFPKDNHKEGNRMQLALDDHNFRENANLDFILQDGLQLFNEIFGYKSKTFIAPCFTWRPELERTLSENGVKGIQGVVNQRVPGNKVIRHWMGAENQFKQRYLLRNCFFEPTLFPSINNVDECLKRIQYAFRWNKPATISAHRINFIGSIHQENRNKNLNLLDKLLSEIVKEYKDVEFISSDQLITIMLND